jgi:hypothetical protein
VFRSVDFCVQNELKFTYVYLQFQKFFRGLYPRTPVKKGRGREGGEGPGRRGRKGEKGGAGKQGRKRRGREKGHGREGRGQEKGTGQEKEGRERGREVKGSLAPTFKTVPPPLEERSGKNNFSTTPLPAVAGGWLKSLFRGFLLGPSSEMSQMADRVGHPRKLQAIIAKSFIDRSGSGLKYWNHDHARCTLVYFS